MALFFYKVTCPVCQMAAPKVQGFEPAYPGRIVGVRQDPEDKLADFDRELEMGFESVSDLPPYELSNAYQIGVVPTLFWHLQCDKGGLLVVPTPSGVLIVAVAEPDVNVGLVRLELLRAAEAVG